MYQRPGTLCGEDLGCAGSCADHCAASAADISADTAMVGHCTTAPSPLVGGSVHRQVPCQAQAGRGVDHGTSCVGTAPVLANTYVSGRLWSTDLCAVDFHYTMVL